ncbi:MAG: hypothetical protein ACRED5_00985 [Propylenella sp.]
MRKLTARKIARAITLSVCSLLFVSGQTAADDVINDDQIVMGRECVGFTCLDGEVFNNDTLRLKDSIVRLAFVDTSDPGFPTRDWRIEANATAGGGASYLALKDMGDTSTGAEGGTALLTLTAGAPANSIFVDSFGRVGLRTSTPILDFHIRTGNTPGLRLEQDGSLAFDPQVWDVQGNEQGFFIRDTTNGFQLPFRILPNAGTNRLVLTNGAIGMGTATPTANLEMVGGTGFKGSFMGAAVEFLARGDLGFAVVGTDTNHPLHLRVNNTPRMVLATSGNVGVGTTTPAAQFHTTGTVRLAGVANCASGIRSSVAGDLSCIPSTRHLKNVSGVLEPDRALANVMALKPRFGSYIDTPDEPEHWLIAEEVAEVDPALVGLKDGEPYTVKTYGVIADLVAVIQQQQRRIEEQQARVEDQQRRIDALEDALLRQ